VYGLAAKWDSRVGVAALFAAKGRSPEQPVAVLFPSVEAVKSALPDLEPAAARVLDALLPGPFTFVVATAVPRPVLVGTADSLGVRVPDRPELLGLMTSLAMPLAATSANRSGGKDATGLADVDPAVLSHCSVAFAAAPGAEAVGAASTVVDLRPLASGGAPLILREGAVKGREVLERIATL
jgi:L-threonylcarbamoyladenylate synthase